MTMKKKKKKEKQTGVESHSDSDAVKVSLHTSQLYMILYDVQDISRADVWRVCEDTEWWQEAKGPQLRSVPPHTHPTHPRWQKVGVLTPGLCLRFPSCVSPHGAPSNSPQQENMRERAKMRVGSWMEGDKLTCGVLWGECPTSRPLITIR